MGGRIRVKVVVRQSGSPFKQTEFDLMYNEGISREGEMIALGEKNGNCQKNRQLLQFGEEKLGRTMTPLANSWKENERSCE